ncbi:response regulator transcription factor [Marinithermofilum abyssi]|nr:response regulator transcription factor [Marinithermofilum abyssi]
MNPFVPFQSNETVPAQLKPRLLISQLSSRLDSLITSALRACGCFQVVGKDIHWVQWRSYCRILKPDVAIVGAAFPETGWAELEEEIREVSQSTPVIHLGEALTWIQAEKLLRWGVSGVLSEAMRPYHLYEAVRLVLQSGLYVQPELVSSWLSTVFRGQGEPALATGSVLLNLTEREAEVLKMMSRGHNNRDIGKALCISEKTVKNHVSNILTKLGVGGRVQAVLLALKGGLVSLDKPEEPLDP